MIVSFTGQRITKQKTKHTPLNITPEEINTQEHTSIPPTNILHTSIPDISIPQPSTFQQPDASPQPSTSTYIQHTEFDDEQPEVTVSLN